jgi:hypothetical protein
MKEWNDIRGDNYIQTESIYTKVSYALDEVPNGKVPC